MHVLGGYTALFSQTPAGAEASPTSCRVRMPAGAAATSKAALTAGIAVIVSHSWLPQVSGGMNRMRVCTSGSPLITTW